MFDNIGIKIKKLAVSIYWLGFSLSIFLSVLYIIFHMRDFNSVIELIIVLPIIIIGCLISWIDSLLIYGFGELIVKTAEIAENTKDANPSDPRG